MAPMLLNRNNRNKRNIRCSTKSAAQASKFWEPLSEFLQGRRKSGMSAFLHYPINGTFQQ